MPVMKCWEQLNLELILKSVLRVFIKHVAPPTTSIPPSINFQEEMDESIQSNLSDTRQKLLEKL